MQFGETGPEFWKVPSPTLSQRKGYSDCFIIFTPQIFDINENTVSRNSTRFSTTKKSLCYRITSFSIRQRWQLKERH